MPLWNLANLKLILDVEVKSIVVNQSSVTCTAPPPSSSSSWVANMEEAPFSSWLESSPCLCSQRKINYWQQLKSYNEYNGRCKWYSYSTLLDTVTCNLTRQSVWPTPKLSIQNTLSPRGWCLCFSPDVNNLSSTSPMLVVVQDDVTVSSIELAISQGINVDLIGSFNAPNLHIKERELKTALVKIIF